MISAASREMRAARAESGGLVKPGSTLSFSEPNLTLVMGMRSMSESVTPPVLSTTSGNARVPCASTGTPPYATNVPVLCIL